MTKTMVVVGLIVLLVAGHASADLLCVGLSYAGTLSSTGGGLSYAGNWTPVTINWTVTENADNTWHYQYGLSSTCQKIKKFILETSTNFTSTDVWNACGPYTSLGLGTWTPAQSNEHMPTSLYGLKFEGSNSTSVTVSFDSTKAPVWGDFYIKDGLGYEAWNAGFAAADPTSAAANGSVSKHILRPDTVGDPCTPIPEPGTFALMAMGLSGLGFVRRRRKAAKA